jgi:hypothetical protein
MDNLVAKSYRLKILQKCFIAIKTSLPASEVYQYIADNVRAFFPLVRINCDLQQVSKRFIAIKRRSVAFIIARYNRKYLNNMKKEAKNYVSFRMFKQNLVNQIAKRLTVEQRYVLFHLSCTLFSNCFHFVLLPF